MSLRNLARRLTRLEAGWRVCILGSVKAMCVRAPNLPRPGRAASTGFICALVALALLFGLTAGAEPPVEKRRAIAELAAAGLSWDEGTRAIVVTDAGRAKLKDLTGVRGALRELQPRSLDLSSCAALLEVDGLRGLRSLQAIYLTDCPVLENVDGIETSDALKKIYLFESTHIQPESLDELHRRLTKCYLVFPDGTGINPPRDQKAGGKP